MQLSRSAQIGIHATIASISALLMGFAPAAQAASVDTDQYILTYDDTTIFGGVSFTGSSSTEQFFGWNGPFTGANNLTPVAIAGPGQSNTFDLPSFTITAKAGYEFSDISFWLGGSQFSTGAAPTASSALSAGLYTTFAGPDGGIGEWTLSGSSAIGSYTTLSFAGGTLTLEGNGGHLFVNSSTGPKFSFGVTAVPEAESWALVLAGLGMAGLMLRRRQA